MMFLENQTITIDHYMIDLPMHVIGTWIQTKLINKILELKFGCRNVNIVRRLW